MLVVFFSITIMCLNSLMDWYNEVDPMNVNKHDGAAIFIQYHHNSVFIRGHIYFYLF